MKKWHELVECIDAYIYVQEKEEIVIAYNENADMAKRIYQYALNTWKLEDNKKWEFDIALDCVRTMKATDRTYVSEHPDVSGYHMGYSMYIRNHYIHCSNLHSYFEADDISSCVMEMILTLLHPTYDFSNRQLCDMYADWDYQKLVKQYGEKYPETFENALTDLTEKNDDNNSAESEIKHIKNNIRAKEGREGFKKIFAEVVHECLSQSEKEYIAQVWKDVLIKLYDRAVIYPLEYNQIKCVEEIGVLREVQGGCLGRKNFSTTEECADYIEENLGLKREHAEFMAECAIEAFKDNKDSKIH